MASLSRRTACFIAESGLGAEAMAERIAVSKSARSMSVILCRGASPRRTPLHARSRGPHAPLRARGAVAYAPACSCSSSSLLQLPEDQRQSADERQELQRGGGDVQPPELDAPRIAGGKRRGGNADGCLQ